MRRSISHYLIRACCLAIINSFKSSLFGIILFLIANPVIATIITVKHDGGGDYTSVQTAYENANNSDTILVYPGTYFENLDINSSQIDITIASLYLITFDESYINNTVIDGNQNGSCIAIRNTNNADIKITGFTIENGSGYSNGGGGGLYIINAEPHISHCIIQNNMCDGGGGFYCQSSTVNISGATIRYNYALIAGGGINCGYGSSVIFDPIDRCNIYLNYSGYGSDFFKTNYAPSQEIIVDTFTVLNPDYHFFFSVDEYELPVDDIELDILHSKINPVNADLYVNPIEGNDAGDGLSPATALKTIAYAHKLIQPDSTEPKKIYLSNGIYSSHTNNEKFPLNPRNYVSLIGTHKDSTIFDLDSLTYILRGYGFTKNFSLQKVTMMEGYGNQYTISNIGGLYIKWCNNISFKNIEIRNCISSSYPGVFVFNTSNLKIKTISIINLQGGICFQISNNDEVNRTFSLENCVISNNGPDADPDTGMGGGLVISGDEETPESMKGEIINLLLSNNRRFLDPNWGYTGAHSGLGIGHNTEVTLVNATVNGNVTENDIAGVAIRVSGDSKLDIYNSIFYGDSIYELSLGSSGPSSYITTANVSYSNIEGGESNVQNWYNQNILNWLDGNIETNPLWDSLSDNPYSLYWNSPCIDAGVPLYEEGIDFPYIKVENEQIVLYKIDGDTLHLPPTDIAGNPRFVNGRIDMGAYEFQDTSTRIRELFRQNILETKIDVFPNPCYAHTFISFELKKKSNVQAIIFDMAGNPIKNLMNAHLSPGKFTMTWEGNDDAGNSVPSGTYMISISLNGEKIAGKKIIRKNK
ncbi:MAG: FlgD immunoglobulin-like domain containing protein [Bacteroidales bacterium]